MVEYIAKHAKQLILSAGTSNPSEIASYLGIKVIYYPFRKLKGLAINSHGHKAIAVNSNLDGVSQRAVLAHEIGHCILSAEGCGYFSLHDRTHALAKIEREANIFATHLLQHGHEPQEGETIETFAHRIGLPTELIPYMSIPAAELRHLAALRDSGELSEEDYQVEKEKVLSI